MSRILILVFCLALFLAIAGQVLLGDFLPALDRDISHRLEQGGQAAPAAVAVFRVFTFLGESYFLAVLALVVVGVLYFRGEKLLALAWVVTVGGEPLLNLAIKESVRRPRPQFAEPLVHETSWSFPSGHSMGSAVVYGMLAYLVMLHVSSRPARWLIGLATAALVLGVGCSRVYLGAHWPSDVAAGFAGAGAWLTLCIMVTEVRRAQAQAGSPPGQTALDTPPGQ